ncbi:MAG: hypothetical protein ACOC2U_05040, partial [bacterium]
QYDQIMPKYELHIQKINGKIAFGDNNPYENPSSNGGINCFVGEYLPPNDNNDSDILHIHGKKGIIFTGGNYMEDNDNIPGNGNGEKIVMEITYNNHDDHVEAKIDGYIEAEDIKVKDVVTADYVFEKDYPLKNIDSLALFIQQQGHLPDMPSAGEMKENGIGLAKMNGRLLQKIEELTLYTIQQQKRIKDLAKKNEKLKEQNEKINEVMKDIEKLKAKMEEK